MPLHARSEATPASLQATTDPWVTERDTLVECSEADTTRVCFAEGVPSSAVKVLPATPGYPVEKMEMRDTKRDEVKLREAGPGR